MFWTIVSTTADLTRPGVETSLDAADMSVCATQPENNPATAASPGALTSRRAPSGAILLDWSSSDPALRSQQVRGILVDIFPLPATAVALGAAHRVIYCRVSALVRKIDVSALRKKIFHDFIPAPKRRSM